jgi:HSP20 family protein
MDALEPWNPWRELEKVQQETDAVFAAALAKLRQALPGREVAFVPVADIVETADDYRILLSLPGVIEEDIDLGLDGQALVVRGEREAPYDPRRVTTHLGQWKYGYFERRVELPAPVEADAIRAVYDAGVLTITVAKPQS